MGMKFRWKWGNLKKLLTCADEVVEGSRAAIFVRDYLMYRQKGVELPFEAQWHWTGRSELAMVEIGDLCRYDHDVRRGRCEERPMPLRDYALYKFLESGDFRYWQEHLDRHPDHGFTAEERRREGEEFLAFRDSFVREGYDISKRAIVLDAHGVVIDGCHRVSCLLSHYGAKHRIRVVRIIG